MMLTEEELCWNRFIEEICRRSWETLSDIQKNAVLCFWYDAEMGSGGHNGYFDCYPETEPQALANAIQTVSYQAIADNFLRAVEEGSQDDYVSADQAFDEFEPSLIQCLMAYVERHKHEIFR